MTSSPAESHGRQEESSEHTQHHSCPLSFYLWLHPSPVWQHTSTQGAEARRECQIQIHSTSRLESIAQLADHGPHGLVRLRRTPDSLLLMHGLSPTTGQHGGCYDPQPVTRSSQWVSASVSRMKDSDIWWFHWSIVIKEDFLRGEKTKHSLKLTTSLAQTTYADDDNIQQLISLAPVSHWVCMNDTLDSLR